MPWSEFWTLIAQVVIVFGVTVGLCMVLMGLAIAIKREWAKREW